MADVQKQVKILGQTIWSFLHIINKDEESTTLFYSAIGVCLRSVNTTCSHSLLNDANIGPLSSALLKLSNHHACESYIIHHHKSLDMAEVAIARELSLYCQETMKEAIAEVLSFINILQNRSEVANNDSLSPWFLDCVYQAAANFTYFASTLPHNQALDYLARKKICTDILSRANSRWKVAGTLTVTPCCYGANTTKEHTWKLSSSRSSSIIQGNIKKTALH